MTFKEKLKACYKILFKHEPIGTITYGVRLVKCSDCEYNLKCEVCWYKGLYEKDYNGEYKAEEALKEREKNA